MLTSLALIFLGGLSLAALCSLLHLPRIIGMLCTGILLGPYVLGLLDPTILFISADLRQMALIIILIKAGLSLDLQDLRRVGRPAILMAFLPASFEILAYVLFAPALLGIDRMEAAVLGAVLGAVSPAVVVPRMVRLIEEGQGIQEGIPQLILAGASCDDVFVIVLFSAFTGMAQGGKIRLADFVGIPVSIVSGVLLGLAAGWGLCRLFAFAWNRGLPMRGSIKVLIVLAVSFLLVVMENWLEGILPLSGLLAVMSMACALRLWGAASVTSRLAEKFGKLWIAAEVLLFVLVGAAVDIRYTLQAGGAAVAMILLALGIRAVGVLLALAGTRLNWKERVFCIIAYLPKATVQAAIGSVPLAMGLPCGALVLSVAVLAILITAPLGAIGIDNTCRRLLRPAR